MAKSTKPNLVILGCGNLAWHLAKRFHQLSYSFSVYNHKTNPALVEFKKKFKCPVSANLNHIKKEADYYFICVSDNQIVSVSKKIKSENKAALVLHCSGSQPLKAISAKHKNTGVFYPLQTFSKKDELDWSKIPLLLEASNDATSKSLKKIAGLFSNKIHYCDFATRLQFHLSAVLVNNFSNALYVAASKILKDQNKASDFKLLLPLIQQTVKKLEHLQPLEAQTGPAKRGDKKAIKKHLDLLKAQPEIRKLYQRMSKLIKAQQNRLYA